MSSSSDDTGYILDDQIGFILRRVNQRHLAVFSRVIPDLTPTQFAALAKLTQLGRTTQNALGRATAMDAATIKGVADRLRAKGLVQSFPDPVDQRRMVLEPTDQGRALFSELADRGFEISAQTLEPLTEAEQDVFLNLLKKLT